jgi:rhodanese-related sulfurtransferase
MDKTNTIAPHSRHRGSRSTDISSPIQEVIGGKRKLPAIGILIRVAGLILLITYIWIFKPELPATFGAPQAAPGINFVKAEELKDWLDQGRSFLLIDARSPAEFAAGHIPQAVNRHAEHPSSRPAEHKEQGLPVVIYCAGPSGSSHSPCARAIIQALQSSSQQVYWFKGGMTAWQSQGYPVERFP